MILRAAALILLLTAPALAQEPEACGACTELDRVTTANPVLPMSLPVPPPRFVADKGTPIEMRVPGTHDTFTVYHKPGVGVWVSDLAPGGIFVRPKNNRLAVEMKF